MARHTTPSLNRTWECLLEIERLHLSLSGGSRGPSEPLSPLN